MRKWLAALILLAMLSTLCSCDDEMLDSLAASGGTAGADAAASDTGGVAQTKGRQELVVYEDRLLLVPYADDSVYKAFSDSVNTLLRWFPDNIHKYLMITPDRISFEPEEVRALGSALGSDQKDEIKYVYKAMDPSVTLIDAYYALSLHTGNLNEIFFRTENHWTHLGAYYAAQAFFEAAAIPYHTLDEYVEAAGEPFLGYLYNVANDPTFPTEPDTLTYYLLPGVDREGSIFYKSVETGELVETAIKEVDPDRFGYGIFLGQNGYSHAIVSGDAASDRALMILGDSFSTAIVSWFADSFNTVILIDPRYYEGGADGVTALLSEYGVTDVLILVSSTIGFSDDLKRMFGFTWLI